MTALKESLRIKMGSSLLNNEFSNVARHLAKRRLYIYHKLIINLQLTKKSLAIGLAYF